MQRGRGIRRAALGAATTVSTLGGMDNMGQRIQRDRCFWLQRIPQVQIFEGRAKRAKLVVESDGKESETILLPGGACHYSLMLHVEVYKLLNKYCN